MEETVPAAQQTLAQQLAATQQCLHACIRFCMRCTVGPQQSTVTHTCVNSGCRSARRSSSRKQRAICICMVQ